MELHWPSAVFGFFTCLITPLVDFIAVYIIKKFHRSGVMRCPKCSRKMALRPAWHHCAYCDTYFITDLDAFIKHWHL